MSLLTRTDTDILEPMEKHVVVALDDDPQTLDALHRLLRKESYELRTTFKPAEALKWIAAGEVSLLLSDHLMPDMLGTQLLEKVGHRSPETARVLLTGYPDSTLLLRDVPSRPLLMYKPWDDDELRETIRQILSEQVAREDA